ncbi:37S ribosomal protein S22 [Collariella sp. IMI 366227]|nr:37S ribosomal protein S22 [Collariella sp. IMI 366227]
MIAAGKMQNRTASSSSAVSRAAAARPWRSNSIRQFSTSRVVRQESTKEIDATEPSSVTPAKTPEEIETVVRQARQTFGGTLPADFLSPEEYKVYERLYGAPLRETRPEDVGIPFPEPEGADEQHVLLRTNEDGAEEEVEYTFDRSTAIQSEETVEAEEGGGLGQLTEAEVNDALAQFTEAEVLEALETLELSSEPAVADHSIDYLQATAKNQREYNALLKLQQDFEAASLQPVEEVREEENIEEEEEPREEEDIDEDEGEPDARFLEGYEHPSARLHAYTRMGQFRTYPSTLQLPKLTFVEPITTLLGRTDISHIQETAERELGGPGLPYGPATPKSKNNLPQKGVLMEAGHHRMSQIEADAYMATILPGVYSSVTSILVEVRKRLGDDWLKGMLTRPDGTGPRVLDAGAGGAGLLAWEEILQAGWEVLREKGEVKGRGPHGKKTVVVGNENLRQRVSRFLHNTTFLPRLPDYIHSVEGAERKLDSGGGPAPRKVFDVIIASHMLMPLEKEYKRKELLDNLWSMLSPEGGVLIFLEKGHPRGFEAVANVRDRILDEFIIPPSAQPTSGDMIQPENERVREPGMIVAPCTNHAKCPMYLTPGLHHGRKDFCHFNQRFIRPPFLQKILGATHRSHEDIKFSYIAVRRGAQPDHSNFLHGKDASQKAFAGYEKVDPVSPPSPFALPRNILTPLKRHGHVTLDLCTPEATIERWVVPKSFSKQAYHDARKAEWGDLWALGAKTRTIRNVRLGKGGVDLKDGGVRSRAAQAANKRRPKVVDVSVDPRFGVVGAKVRGREEVQRRTKGGRKRVKLDDLMAEMGVDKFEEADEKDDKEYMRS